VRLLFDFDENVSRRLLRELADMFPDSGHVTAVGLERAADRDVWQFSRDNGYAPSIAGARALSMALLLRSIGVGPDRTPRSYSVRRGSLGLSFSTPSLRSTFPSTTIEIATSSTGAQPDQRLTPGVTMP
jgi:Domain of unknown function (DUF5615)